MQGELSCNARPLHPGPNQIQYLDSGALPWNCSAASAQIKIAQPFITGLEAGVSLADRAVSVADQDRHLSIFYSPLVFSGFEYKWKRARTLAYAICLRHSTSRSAV